MLGTIRAVVGRRPSVLLVQAEDAPSAARLRETPAAVAPGDYLRLEVSTPSAEDAGTDSLEVLALVSRVDHVSRPGEQVDWRPGLRLELEVARISRGRVGGVPSSALAVSPAAEGPPCGIVGRLGAVPLPDVLQFLELGGRTARVDVRPRGALEGRIYLAAGRPVHAECGGRVGPEALALLVQATQGHFRIRFDRPAPRVTLPPAAASRAPGAGEDRDAANLLDLEDTPAAPVTLPAPEALPHPDADRTFASLQAALAFLESGDPALHALAVSQSCPAWPNSTPPVAA